MRTRITFKRIEGKYIVTVNGAEHKFSTYLQACTFIQRIRKEVA